jgi:hypothetical protein
MRTDMRVIRCRALGLGVFHFLWVVAMQAQQVVRPDMATCAAAESALQAHQSSEDVGRAVADLSSGCPDAGPRALAAKWSQPPTDPVALSSLANGSAHISDARLLRALRATVLASSNPQHVRFEALRALVGQFDPSLSISFRAPEPTDRSGGSYVVWGILTGGGDYGAQPVGAAGRAQVLQTLHQLQTNDPDIVMRKVAAYIAQQLQGGT